MRATTCENFPAGFFAVPLNIRCSRKCASPDLPGVSSAAPTLYQIICVTTGALWSGITTSSNPLPNMKSEICGPLGADCALLAIASNAAMAAAVVKRYGKDRPFSRLLVVELRPSLHEDVARSRISRHMKFSASLTRVGAIGVVVIGLLRSYTVGKAVGLIGRRGLVADRRFSQRGARRLS